MSDRLAREHADRMMAAVAAHRLVREARRSRWTPPPARLAPRSAGAEEGRLTTLAHAAAWPVSAMLGWLAAGQL